ncbi:MAG TPA: FecR domain-containing protein, partial [Treponemataceae bacterium]|nr:FecR domain-containing protein [Treponemataceae bacterium]
LTRMTLTQLVEKEDTVDTELYLEVGNVKAEVNSLNNKKNGFTVKSPVATASVRGTVFEIGEELVVLQGSVVFVTPIGQTRTGQAGQQLQLVGETVSSPVAALQEKMETIVLTSTPSTEIKSPVKATVASPPPPRPVVTAEKPVIAPPPPKPTTVVVKID